MEYQILATYVAVISPTEFRCTVAIDAGNDYWRAYTKIVDAYPDWQGLQAVAYAGSQLPAAAAKRLFPKVASQYTVYG